MRVVGGRTFTVVLLMAGVGATPNPVSACERDCSTNPVEIPVLSGYEQSRVRQINNQGDIAGQAVRVTEELTQVPAVWRRGRHGQYAGEILPLPDGFSRGEARGFATRFVPVGSSFDSAGTFRATAWPVDRFTRQRVPVDLEPPPGFTDARALSGNGQGLVVGDAWNIADVTDGLLVRHAVLWRYWPDGQFRVCDLDVPDGYVTSTASDVNLFGVVVGTASARSAAGLASAPFVWRPTSLRDPCRFEAIPLPNPATARITVPSINERGDVVAQAGSSTSTEALIWRRLWGRYSDPETLPVPEGYADALARTINARGIIVGTAHQRSAKGALTGTSVVLWRSTPRGWESWVLTNPADTVRIDSEHLNDQGEVIADSATPAAGSSGAFLWVNATRGQCSPSRKKPFRR